MNEHAAIAHRLTLEGLATWPWEVLRRPRSFFERFSRTGGYGSAALYAAAVYFVTGVIGALIAALRTESTGGTILAKFIGVLLLPWILVGLTFVAAGVAFVVWHLMGSKEDYRSAFRVLCFLTPVFLAGSLLGLIPYLPLVAWLYGFYLLVVASMEFHHLPRVRSWAVWSSLAGGLLLAVLGLAVLRVVAGRVTLPSPRAAEAPMPMPTPPPEFPAELQLPETPIPPAESPVVAPAESPAPSSAPTPRPAPRNRRR